MRVPVPVLQEMFFDAIFELCDLWTSGIGANEYAGFLDGLFSQVRVRRAHAHFSAPLSSPVRGLW